MKRKTSIVEETNTSTFHYLRVLKVIRPKKHFKIKCSFSPFVHRMKKLLRRDHNNTYDGIKNSIIDNSYQILYSLIIFEKPLYKDNLLYILYFTEFSVVCSEAIHFFRPNLFKCRRSLI